jgi:hypothetical protein
MIISAQSVFIWTGFDGLVDGRMRKNNMHIFQNIEKFLKNHERRITDLEKK